jgi:DNA-binding GntR family transcriptional regulator
MMSAKKKSHCLNDLKARILSMDIAPGSNLDEANLTAQYGMSRTPLREVLQRLSGDGFVLLEENRGATVASMDLATMRVFFQTAPLVYCSIARQAAENRTTRQLDALKAVQKQFAQAARAGVASEVALLNHRFHEIIGEMAQNPYLMAALGRMLIDHARLSLTFFEPRSEADESRIAKAVSQHDGMISAIEAREPSLATDLTLQHWDLSRDQMERFVRPDPLPIDVVSMKDRKNAV